MSQQLATSNTVCVNKNKKLPLIWATVSWFYVTCLLQMFSSVAQMFSSVQHTRLPGPSPTPRACSDSCPLSPWCHPTISSSVIPCSSCLQFLPTSGSFPVGQFFASGGQIIGASASTSVFPMNIQDWSPLGWTGWISLQSKGLSKSLLQHHSSKSSIPRHVQKPAIHHKRTYIKEMLVVNPFYLLIPFCNICNYILNTKIRNKSIFEMKKEKIT